MITIGSYPVPECWGYSVDLYDLLDSSNGFMTQDCTQHDCVLAQKYKITLSVDKIKGASLASMLTAISSSSFSVTFTVADGTTTTKTMKCHDRPYGLEKYVASNYILWNVSFTLEEV